MYIRYETRTENGPAFGMSVFEYSTESEAKMALLATNGRSNEPAMEPCQGIGTLARKLAGSSRPNDRWRDPVLEAFNFVMPPRVAYPVNWSESLRFVRGRYGVYMTYTNGVDSDPSSKSPFMGGDARAFFWKSAREIDSRLKAYLTGHHKNRSLRD